MSSTLKIYCKNTSSYIDIKGGETLNQIYERISHDIHFLPICAIVNNKTEGLGYSVFNPKIVEFMPSSSPQGHKVYIHSLCMILYKAIRDIYNDTVSLRIEHSISRGYFCRLSHGNSTFHINAEELELLKNRMKEIVGENLPFERKERLTSDVKKLFEKENLHAKVELLDTRHDLYTVYYRLGNVIDSYYGDLAPSTGHIKIFDLHEYKDGFLLLGPEDSSAEPVARKPIVQEKMYRAFTEHLEFNRIIGVKNVGELNKAVIANQSAELINVAEALHDKKISSIADTIAERYHNGGARIVLVAGPSSSGKTTTTQRLGIYLLTNLLRPVMISLDNYFVDRKHTPLDENGEKDYEHLHALDLDLFNSHLNALLNGEEIEMPYYSFELGQRIYRGEKIKLNEGDVLLIEGIHGLNPELTESIDEKMKFRLYVSALTTLSIDDHNWVPTTDNRLLRRIIRDYKYRGTSAIETIRRWPSVRRGEERWIFPFQENADAMFNSSLIFELGVMKEYGEKILSQVPNDCAEYGEAYRLKKFLNYFEPIRDNLIPPTSLLREFLGGSSLKY